jgi:excinuclease UvrABC nuclease subunit
MALSDGNGHKFSEFGIFNSASTQSGVYAIYNSTKWIYVGEAQDIQARLFSHLRGESDQSTCILRNGPTGFDFELAPALVVRKIRERFWIDRLDPVCNRT